MDKREKEYKNPLNTKTEKEKKRNEINKNTKRITGCWVELGMANRKLFPAHQLGTNCNFSLSSVNATTLPPKSNIKLNTEITIDQTMENR